MIKSISRYFRKDSPNIFYTVEVDITEAMKPYMIQELTEKIADGLATKYLEEYSDEFLKRINQKCVDSKVISKVIERLRKEKDK